MKHHCRVTIKRLAPLVYLADVHVRDAPTMYRITRYRTVRAVERWCHRHDYMPTFVKGT